LGTKWQFYTAQGERSQLVRPRQVVHVEHAAQVDVGLQPFETGKPPGWAVERQPSSGSSAVAANPEQAVQIDAMIRMFVVITTASTSASGT